ncbi:unnamed protein product [Notodromas monacha]|uniref:Peroxin/Ferlin domain-containing protein n=1 Tax=Notodromas monacha TaxID=399045 RepID=A0A7R9BG38_9CRUS|nr:unnamed protein product [Notodromas monacha]CAG0914642.1 unnamed protein product [Notodromas monacha]
MSRMHYIVPHWQVQNLSGPASPDALWSTTTRGDIFIHESQAAANSLQSDRKKLVDMRWRQMGGSLLKVECCPAGIAWGIGWDYGAWVYSGGFGGGPWESLYSEKTKPQSDTRCFYVYENQRWNPVTGYNSTLLPTDRPQWSDYSGRIAVSKSSMKPPSGKWQWTGEWQIDFTTPGGVDGNGWQYALDFPSSYHPTKGFTDYVRRRRWFRKCKNSTTGPWLYVGSTRLVDITLQLDPQPEGFVGVWAVAANGDILMREEVSPEQPLGKTDAPVKAIEHPLNELGMRSTPTTKHFWQRLRHLEQGNGWKHVPCDEPVVSISFGRYGKVWAVAKNGSVYLRHGITQSCPEGELWLHLECPSETKLVQISAGSSEVWVVDEAHRLYRRKDVMPTMFPEGVSWEYVCDNIRQVSVDAKDEIWAIAEKANLAGSTYNGVVCQRSGRTTTSLAGSGWDYGIGGGWQYICVRGAPVKST